MQEDNLRGKRGGTNKSGKNAEFPPFSPYGFPLPIFSVDAYVNPPSPPFSPFTAFFLVYLFTMFLRRGRRHTFLSFELLDRIYDLTFSEELMRLDLLTKSDTHKKTAERGRQLKTI